MSVFVNLFIDRYLVLHVLDKALVGDTEAMGQVYIDLSNLDIHHGYSGRFPLADLVGLAIPDIEIFI